MLRGSIPLGRVAGIGVRANWSVLATMALLTLDSGRNAFITRYFGEHAGHLGHCVRRRRLSAAVVARP
jgi:hypothetical protein